MAPKKRSEQSRTTQGSLGIRCYIACHQEDRTYTRQLGQQLAAMDVDSVLVEKTTAVSDWVNTLYFVDEADVVIALFTRKALASDSFLSQIDHASNRGSRFLPIIFDDVVRSTIPDWLMPYQFLFESHSAKAPSPRVLSALTKILEQIKSEVTQSGSLRTALETPPPQVLSEKRLLNEGKLILVGRGEVGKTSLVKRLVENQFNEEESKTQGIRITNWFLPRHADTIRLNIWDFGGQEIMHATHQFFLTERSLYLLVLNGREGGEDVDAEYWLKHIESFGGESPVIVVQNKIAQHPFELNYRGLLARYPQIRGFIKTDCKEQVGLQQLRELVQSAIAGMSDVQMQFPADWFMVKQRLESMGNDYLGYQEFAELCAKEGIKEEPDREKLGFVLHCLGIALNYRDDLRLRETSILKPEWVTHGIYSILNARKLADDRGELLLGDLRQILPGKRYPVEKHLFLVELMRKFSLCFPFEGEPDRYLVPELLGKEEPEEVASFHPERCLNFEYHYGIMPEGLVPRFIVRTHTLSRSQPRWRSGVVLAYEDCRALVKAEPLEQRVVVRVAGGDGSARRNLLAIIRYDLDRIHAEFKDRLDAQAKVPLAEFPSFSVDYKKLVAFERQGVREFPEFIGQKVVTVNVSGLLNGVDFEDHRGDSLESLARAKSLFFSYSHKDEALRDELETHLKLLQRQGYLSLWHDRKIPSGDEWDREIDNRIERASIILLLISADFIASEYCWEKEVKRALERHEERKATVVPLLMRACDWKSAPFAKLQALPANMKPVTAWTDRDAAWADVAAGIRKIVIGSHNQPDTPMAKKARN